LAKVTFAAFTPARKPFELKLRLPGQVFDAETGLNQNYYRDYDSQLGRYVTADPMGIEGGINPYSYTSNSPLMNVDPAGLYEEDIHFYMTYFLARAAGVDARRAYVIATATQYVDDNPVTQPTKPSLLETIAKILFDNAAQQEILLKYHFTQSPEDDDPTKPTETRYIQQPKENAQLNRLHQAADNARVFGSECAGDIMFGEYLHAFEDTFGHRDANNIPIAVNGGWGHAAQLHSPDHTYNEDFTTTNPESDQVYGMNWQYNEARTLEMEHEVFDKMLALSGTKTNSHSWCDIEPLLRRFNAKKENGQNTAAYTGPSDKVQMLNDFLSDPNGWNLKFVGMDGKDETLNLTTKAGGGYNSSLGDKNRNDFLRYNDSAGQHKAGDKFDKKDKNFEGTILP
jgi:RHS repeat-associated protein